MRQADAIRQGDEMQPKQEKAPQIVRSMSLQGKLIETLHDKIGNVEEVFQSVLSAPRPETFCEDEKKPEPECPLAGFLNEHNAKLSGLIMRLERLRERCEL